MGGPVCGADAAATATDAANGCNATTSTTIRAAMANTDVGPSTPTDERRQGEGRSRQTFPAPEQRHRGDCVGRRRSDFRGDIPTEAAAITPRQTTTGRRRYPRDIHSIGEGT